MSGKVVESREIVWCNDDDRYILIIRSNDEVIGLNYMQGDELDIFKRDFSDIDYELTDFYNAIHPYLAGESRIGRINQAIWAHFEYKNLRDDRKYNNNNEL
jgi:hypothetical protein